MQPYSLTVDKILEHAAKWSGDREIVTAEAGRSAMRVHYAGLRARSNRLSGALAALGIHAQRGRDRRRRYANGVAGSARPPRYVGGELPRLQRILIGGSNCPDVLIERIEKRLGAGANQLGHDRAFPSGRDRAAQHSSG